MCACNSYSRFLQNIGQDELLQAFEQDHTSFETKLRWFAATLHALFKATHACYSQACQQQPDYREFFEHGSLPGVVALPVFARRLFDQRYGTGSLRNRMLVRFLVVLEHAVQLKSAYALMFRCALCCYCYCCCCH